MINQVVIALRSLDVVLHSAEQGLERSCKCTESVSIIWPSCEHLRSGR